MSRKVTFDERINYKQKETLALSKKEMRNRRAKLIHIDQACQQVLTPRQFQIYKMYYFEGINQEEIAERLGVTQQAVSKSIRTSNRKVIKILKVYVDEQR